MQEFWSPYVARAEGLVRPVRLDPTGRAGPTRGQARGRAWRRTSHGWYVPSDVPDCVEQRILEQSVRLPRPGALTAWSALRWYGARYFDGLDRRTGAPLPVAVALGTWLDIARDDRIHVTRERLWPSHLNVVDGVACAVPERALFDELRRRPFRSAVAAADMTFAVGLCCTEVFAEFVDYCRNGWIGVPYVRRLLPFLCDDERSPQETWMRLVWDLAAGLPRPVMNRPVFDRTGRLIGVPDLLDPVAGVVGEYDGAHHDDPGQRGSDVEREERFRDHGLEYFTVVRAHRADPAALARRMHAVRRRARFLAPDQRAWTCEAPAWWARRAAG